MKIIRYSLLFFLTCLFNLSWTHNIVAQDTSHIEVIAQEGDALSKLLDRYELLNHPCDVKAFEELNTLNKDKFLLKGLTYKLPIVQRAYNGQSIRTTLEMNDLPTAKAIQAFNERMLALGHKKLDYREDNELWIPYHLSGCKASVVEKIAEEEATEESALIGSFDIFGEDNAPVMRKGKELEGRVYYLVSGHGGPDPGAVVSFGYHTLCEDEYAYDVTLRLAHNLLAHGAKVYLITRDRNDGIRDEAYLDCDKDEQCWKGQPIPARQKTRLAQRAKAVNALYGQHKDIGAAKQRMIVIHVDSRAQKRRVDMFFYHYSKSKRGLKMAETLRQTVKDKYAQYQKNRGYTGTVKSRDLYVLKEALPAAVYIELGNLRNALDQKRFTIASNRQAIADWLAEGVIKDATE